MNVLFIHQNFPAQFKHLAPALAKAGHQVVAITLKKGVDLPGVKVLRYRFAAKPGHSVHRLVRETEVKAIRGEGVALLCDELRQKGFTPDVIYVHPGWGEALFLRDVYPNTKIIVYCEYYYRQHGQDVNFDPEFHSTDLAEAGRLRMKNTCNLHALEVGDAFVAPTRWQRRTYPRIAQKHMQVIHDGIDLDGLARVDDVELPFEVNGPLVTYVSRYLEPMRGFHMFMRALPQLLREVPHARVVIIGSESGGYGPGPAEGGSWKQQLLNELQGHLDPARVSFLGQVPYPVYKAILRASDLHVYLTYPFVLSWSMLEAAYLCKQVLVSDTAPLDELKLANISRCDFFDAERISRSIAELLRNPLGGQELAQQQLDYYSLPEALSRHGQLLESLLGENVGL